MTRSDDDPLLASLLAAVTAASGDVPLRLHVAGLLLDRGRPAEALEHCSTVLRSDPTHAEALALLRRASAELGATGAPSGEVDANGLGKVRFDWDAAEAQIRDLGAEEPATTETLPADGGTPDPVGDSDVGGVVFSDLTLADVGGMTDVKQRLDRAFLGPMRNPELAKAFGKRLTGGLLLYGPPGCGKTFLARALAGELRARFYLVGLADILDSTFAVSEKNVQRVFETARRNAPCVLFLDEVDAIGQKRSQLRNSSGMRTIVNQLLFEMDSVAGRGEGVFVLGATNHPWDVDTALRRPGRFDRMILVAPPDASARSAILRYHLRDRPVANLDVGRLVAATDGFSGADLAHVAETATESALADSLQLGHARPIAQEDFDAALREVRPSVGPWLETAKNVAMFANGDGSYDDLVAYLKARRVM